MKNKLLLCFLLSLIALIACQQDSTLITGIADNQSARAAVNDITHLRIIKDSGIIRYIGLEGGFYGIVCKSGNYDPINLPREFMKDGLSVEFTAEICYDMASYHMWGTLVKLISMQTTNSRKKIVMDTGIMHQYFIQGHPWVIAGTTGSYQPINLPDKFEIEGLNVRFVGFIRTDIIIIPPLWPLIELTNIEAIDNSPLPVNLYEEFKLQVGKSAIVQKDNVLFTFKSVIQDSRCPSDVICVWQGEAVINVNVKIGDVDYGDFKMSTYRPNIIYVGTYYIQFNNLYPYPATNIKINPNEYVGYFLIGSILDTPRQ